MRISHSVHERDLLRGKRVRGEMGLSLNPEEPAGKPGEYGGTEPRESGALRGRGQLTVPGLRGAQAG